MKKDNTEDIYDCIIVGAGPAGLSLAYYLKNKCRYLVLEKGSVGQSWHDMSSCFELITPMWTNSLPGDAFRLNPFTKLSCNQYGEYLREYNIRNGFNLHEDEFVVAVKKRDRNTHIVETNKSKYITNKIVLCCGYYSNPNKPGYFKCEPGIIHAADYKSANDYKGLNEVLIVGKKNTAGQLLVDLYKSGFNVSLSIRGKLEFRLNHGILRKIKESLYFFWEELLIYFNPFLKQDSYPPMDSEYAKDIIESGNVNIYPDIEEMKEGEVLFSEGIRKKFDLIVFATGYNPAFSDLLPIPDNPHPGDTLEKLKKSNVYVLGLDNLYNFRSRYIRGMKRDAAKMAEIIVED